MHCICWVTIEKHIVSMPSCCHYIGKDKDIYCILYADTIYGRYVMGFISNLYFQMNMMLTKK